MKKSLLLLCMPIILIGLNGCEDNNEIVPTDYSKVTNWHKCEYTGTKDVDCFYIYPTIVDNSHDESGLGTIEEARVLAGGIYTTQTSVYAESCNIFMPMYRQVAFDKAMTFNADNKAYRDFIYTTEVYADIEASLDYYFQNFNKNKPFILAGHSQGSAVLNVVLQHYMQEHSELASRMIAAYSIGFAPSKSEYASITNMHFATGETDVNAIISWNTFGPNHTGKSILMPEDPYVINPLNWKTDSTKAELSENHGSMAANHEIVSGLGDAQIDSEGKYVICTTRTDYVDGVDDIFGTNSLHTVDYTNYYVNIKENVAKRIDAFNSK